MNKQLSLASLLAIAVFAVIPMAAQAATQTLTSNATNSFCINPTEASFKPTNPDTSPNYLPLETSREGPFPDSGAACSPSGVTNPTPVPTPFAGWANPPIAGTEWVGAHASGSGEGGPNYYIYDATFSVCRNQVSSATIAGEMYADNEAGAFLNGKSIGFQPLHSDKHNFGSGPPTPFGASAPGPFVRGLNTLQIVVYDNDGATGLDFTATVTTSGPCEEHDAQLGRCVKAKGGIWSEKTCETLASEGKPGKFEWQPNCIKCGTKSKSTKTIISIPAAGATVECKKDTDIGKYTSPAKNEEEFTFEKCSVPALKQVCTTAGQAAGTIKTSLLESEIGVISQVPQVVGLELKAKAVGQPIAEFTCGETTFKLTGSVIGQVTPFSLMTKVFTVTWQESAGQQNPERFEGEPKDTLVAEVNGSGPLAATLIGKDKITNEERLEIDIF